MPDKNYPGAVRFFINGRMHEPGTVEVDGPAEVAGVAGYLVGGRFEAAQTHEAWMTWYSSGPFEGFRGQSSQIRFAGDARKPGTYQVWVGAVKGGATEPNSGPLIREHPSELRDPAKRTLTLIVREGASAPNPADPTPVESSAPPVDDSAGPFPGLLDAVKPLHVRLARVETGLADIHAKLDVLLEK